MSDLKSILISIIEENPRGFSQKIKKNTWQSLIPPEFHEHFCRFISEDQQKTCLNIRRFTEGQHFCEICGKETKLLTTGWKCKFAKFCSEECERKNIQNRQKGVSNQIHRMSETNKQSWKENIQKKLNSLIVSGKYTPTSNNYRNHKALKIKFNNKVIEFRSLWEILFFLENPSYAYEEIRLRYIDENGKTRTYIADFYDKSTNTLYEVKPSKYLYTMKHKLTQEELHGFNYKIVTEFEINKIIAQKKYSKEYILQICLNPTDIERRLQCLK